MTELLFVVLNMTDAGLTNIGLQLGAVEVNPLMSMVGSVPVIKGLIAVALIAADRKFGSGWAIWFGNHIVFTVVVWNSFMVMKLVLGG
ncbi:MAG: hypothetical protein HW414_1760 [Dehalococcoidia bacterium]|nr:hypothetical protein [Dehalococcoidia bacterium]